MHELEAKGKLPKFAAGGGISSIETPMKLSLPPSPHAPLAPDNPRVASPSNYESCTLQPQCILGIQSLHVVSLWTATSE